MPVETHQKREEEVPFIDWSALRDHSLQPGGFADQRPRLWPLLLGVENDEAEAVQAPCEEEAAHSDERQIGLDTDRSFVLYPDDKGESKSRDELKSELHALLVHVFRRRRKLRYFQGYHDIITVLFLTLPAHLRISCAEKLSLHRLRDSMGSGLEPVIGLLHVLQNLLRLSDPSFAASIDEAMPLPYYALSNILTLFSHDMPTLALIQHTFDYILCRPPIIVVYLAAVLALNRKSDVEMLEEEGEEGMIHSFLSSLPELVDSEEGIIQSRDEEKCLVLTEEDTKSPPLSGKVAEEEAENDIDPSPHQPPPYPHAAISNDASPMYTESMSSETSLDENDIPSDTSLNGQPEKTIPPNTPPLGTNDEKIPTSPAAAVAADTPIKEEDGSRREQSENSTTDQVLATEKRRDQEEFTDDDDAIAPPPGKRVAKSPVPLCSLLRQADELFSLYPPSHPDLALSSIMGPQSVVFTWSEHFDQLPDDDEAEAMVEHPDLIVRPPPPPQPSQSEGYEKIDDNVCKRPVSKRRGSNIQKRRVWVTAALVVGVAVAVYGFRNTRLLPPFAAPDSAWMRLSRRVSEVLHSSKF